MMQPEMILRSDLPDIVFDNRNKEYGAYLLRKEYHRRLLIALSSIPVVVGLFLWMNYLNRTVHSNIRAGVNRGKGCNIKTGRL